MSTANNLLDAAITVAKNLDSLSKLPYCTGTFPWDKDKFTLFYKGESAGFLKFPATYSQLESLSNACSAGKIDPSDFGMSVSPCPEGLVGALEDGLHIDPKNIELTLSKLNVYGPGGSLDALNHLDTPSSMIASLVVILPTVHEGGSLILRHDGKEWTFDSSKAVSTTPSAQAAFIALNSDVKHEIKTVTSGYLVTLTYKVHLKEEGKKSLALTSKQENEPELKEALDRLLKDPAFFPDGGFIGFGLSHKYPFVVGSTKLSDIKKGLKGSDATIKRACEDLSLGVSVYAVYFDEDQPGRTMLIDDPLNFNYQVESIFDHLADFGAKAVTEYKQNSDYDDEPIAWLRPSDKTNRFTFYYIDDDYKRPYMVDVNAEICLVARISPAQERGLPIVSSPGVEQQQDSSGPKKKRRLNQGSTPAGELLAE